MKLSDWALALALGAAAGVQLFIMRAQPGADVAPPPLAATPARTSAASPPARVAEPAVTAAPVEADGSAPVVERSAPSWQGERWTEEMLDALLVEHAELELEPDEVARLKEVYVYCQQVRTEFEAEIAEVLAIDASHARIRIPPYPQAGARLEQMLVEELTAELGEESFERVDGSLGETFEVAFKGFGTGAQLLEVELGGDVGTGLWYRIAAQLDFVDPVDPEAGSDGTPLLTTTSNHLLRAETVATGEWRPLARHFPRLPEPDGEGRSTYPQP